MLTVFLGQVFWGDAFSVSSTHFASPFIDTVLYGPTKFSLSSHKKA